MGTVHEFVLGVYDTHKLMKVEIAGDYVSHHEIKQTDDEDLILVLITEGNKRKTKLVAVEVHPTGYIIPDPEEVVYAGSGVVDGFVWHIFYTIIEDRVEPEFQKIYTIHKYPIIEKIPAIVRGDDVRVLCVGAQYGRPMAWIMYRPGQNRETKVTFVECADNQETIQLIVSKEKYTNPRMAAIVEQN